jgi:hypothetical protein
MTPASSYSPTSTDMLYYYVSATHSSYIEVFKKVKAKKKKENWFKRHLFGKPPSLIIAEEDTNEIIRFKDILRFELHNNYSEYIHTNLMEVSNKSSQKLVQLYARNAHEYKHNLGDNSEVYIFNPCFSTLMAMGGLDIIWPFTDKLFMFEGGQLESMHRDVLKIIRKFNFSIKSYPDYREFITTKSNIDAKIEGYYRKYIDLEKKSILSDKDGEYNSDDMFVGEFPLLLYLDLLSR